MNTVSKFLLLGVVGLLCAACCCPKTEKANAKVVQSYNIDLTDGKVIEFK